MTVFGSASVREERDLVSIEWHVILLLALHITRAGVYLPNYAHTCKYIVHIREAFLFYITNAKQDWTVDCTL